MKKQQHKSGIEPATFQKAFANTVYIHKFRLNILKQYQRVKE